MLPFASQASAQNVSGYGMIPEPFLFLLREPAVHADLGLSAEQKQRLVEINESFDGILLATRNMQPEEGQKRIAEVMTKTREQVSQLFSSEQQTRLRQIAYRLRGLSFVLIPHVSEQLGLSDQQKHDIEAIVKATVERISEVQTRHLSRRGGSSEGTAELSLLLGRRNRRAYLQLLMTSRNNSCWLSLVGTSIRTLWAKCHSRHRNSPRGTSGSIPNLSN